MDILLAGSIAFDYLMHFPGRFKDSLIEQSLDRISLSFLVEDMQKHDGGVSANIAYTMGLLGSSPRLFGTVGMDFEAYRTRLEAAGVDTSTVVVIDDVYTGSFFSNSDLDNNQIASFYSGAMDYAEQYGIEEVAGNLPDLVVISPNAPAAMINLAAECRAKDIPYMYDPSQQVARLSGEALYEGIAGCWILACNEYEWEIIQRHTEWTIDKLQQAGKLFVHTLGEDGANLYHDGEVTHIPPVKLEYVLNPTGAGDAFRAGFLRGIELDLPLFVSGSIGALCGTYALEYTGTQNHRFTVAEFVDRYRKHYDDKGALDILKKS